LKIGRLYENKEDSDRESKGLEIWEEKERIKEINDPQNADRIKMNAEDCIEYNEKVEMQDGVIDYKYVML
jgi:hypothetical protein